jgi:hypothetical protein
VVGFFWGSSSTDDASGELQLSEAEKKQVFSAIGYDQKSVVVSEPPEYVATDARFKLNLISFELLSKKTTSSPLSRQSLAVFDIFALSGGFSQRPTADAMLVSLQIEKFVSILLFLSFLHFLPSEFKSKTRAFLRPRLSRFSSRRSELRVAKRRNF